jgi:23S rRNA (guanosine2251-2'-O)-methyltransferase
MGRPKRTQAGREHRIRYGDDLVWGIHPVLEMLHSQPQRIVELCIQKDKQSKGVQEIIDAARTFKIKCLFVDKIKIGGSPEPINHQGIVAKGAPITLLPFDDLLAYFKMAIEKGETPRLMACDSIQDPHNLGAIIRSAHAAGVSHLIVPRDRSAPLSGTAAKASAGAIAKVKISQVTNLAEALKQVKEAGGWIFGAVKDDQAVSIYETDFNVPVCLVVGNEGSGLRPLVKRHCDMLVSIPMVGELDSLNSSVAAAVILFEMVRQSLN